MESSVFSDRDGVSFEKTKTGFRVLDSYEAYEPIPGETYTYVQGPLSDTSKKYLDPNGYVVEGNYNIFRPTEGIPFTYISFDAFVNNLGEPFLPIPGHYYIYNEYNPTLIERAPDVAFTNHDVHFLNNQV